MKGESSNRSSKHGLGNVSTKSRRTATDDDFDDFQTSSHRPQSDKSVKTSQLKKYASSGDRNSSQLPHSKSHSDTHKDQHNQMKPVNQKPKSLKLTSSSVKAGRHAPITSPLSGGNVRALSFLKKGSSSSNSSVSTRNRQLQDIFAASLATKANIKPLNPFAVSSSNSNKPDTLTLPPSRKNKRKRDNDANQSIDEIKARMITVSALDHSTESTKSTNLKCPYCHQNLEQPLSESLQAKLTSILASLAPDEKEDVNTGNFLSADNDLQISGTTSVQSLIRPRHMKTLNQASNNDRYLFCLEHRKEQVILPEGKRKGYYIDINFDDIESRVEEFVQDLEDIINKKTPSIYRDRALAAYEELGKNKARSTLKILERFESHLPGYYGAEGSHRILRALTKLLIHTGKLNTAHSEPQDPVEYLQQVLLPESGRRLIAQDIENGRTSQRNDSDDLLTMATAIMEESSEFGNIVHPHPDDDIEDDGHTSDELGMGEVSKFAHFLQVTDDSEEENEEDSEVVYSDND
ncbi:hypothetical protein INT43_003726 [Umbelopsis isabellina]|uniref:Restriction of telomere capping protein 4 n=1 Tax=Mortierella isabellina TaxID=91625 RepID=A0A8H7PSW8_MORIS|nr:hypothetical protein INT43_003726 [Umbelopsis isabellina]